MVNSFYDEQLDEGCAFEELISFHGGMGGPQTRPFLLHPVDLAVPGDADHRRRGGAPGAGRLAPRAAGRVGAVTAACADRAGRRGAARRRADGRLACA